jgi:hypothetical protein
MNWKKKRIDFLQKQEKNNPQRVVTDLRIKYNFSDYDAHDMERLAIARLAPATVENAKGICICGFVEDISNFFIPNHVLDIKCIPIVEVTRFVSEALSLNS